MGSSARRGDPAELRHRGVLQHGRSGKNKTLIPSPLPAPLPTSQVCWGLRQYLSLFWYQLDLVVVISSLVSAVGCGYPHIRAFAHILKSLRPLRECGRVRPLRSANLDSEMRARRRAAAASPQLRPARMRASVYWLSRIRSVCSSAAPCLTALLLLSNNPSALLLLPNPSYSFISDKRVTCSPFEPYLPDHQA